jgi:hypothetical protein
MRPKRVDATTENAGRRCIERLRDRLARSRSRHRVRLYDLRDLLRDRPTIAASPIAAIAAPLGQSPSRLVVP